MDKELHDIHTRILEQRTQNSKHKNNKELNALNWLYDISGNVQNTTEEYKIVKAALQRLEAIDNANPSEALECLRLLGDFEWRNIRLFKEAFPDLFATIEQALIKSQEQERLLKSGDLSDGYHAFNQLYYQRCILFASLVRLNKDKSWKSFKHSDGKYCFDSNGEWFIVGIDTPIGPYTYHYEKKYWDLFECQELECAKEWDGHTEEDVTRLLSLPSEASKNLEVILRKAFSCGVQCTLDNLVLMGYNTEHILQQKCIGKTLEEVLEKDKIYIVQTLLKEQKYNN